MSTLRAAVLVALVPLALPAQCDQSRTYSPCEMVFELSAQDATTHVNPYASVDLRIEFRSPRRRTYAMPAYWDGGRRMVVRFAPTESGQWDYHVTSNVPSWNDKTGSFAATASDSPGFIRPANMHHWAYSEKTAGGLDQAHLWMGADELRFPSLSEAAFRELADVRAGQKFNHMRGLVIRDGASAFSGPEAPVISYFQQLDARVRYLNDKGLIADLVLASDPTAIAKAFPNWEQRRRFVRFLVARYAPMNVTWQGVEQFEGHLDGRAVLKEVGGLLKELDPYQHPRTAGARITSTPLLDDGWMDFAINGTSDIHVGAIEHQLYAVPFVNTNLGAGDPDAAAFRKRLWNATMNGQYVSGSSAAGIGAMTVWFNFLSGTRYWELEPYFDVDGGRAVALEDTEYVVYIEKPGPIELTVEKHGYDIYWINPADGQSIKAKKFSGEHFTGEPPDRSHDWVLHVVREGRVAGMNKSYKFSSRQYDLVLQQVEANTPKVPFAIEQPTGDLSLAKPAPFAAKLTRESRATRSMLWLWVGDVAADGQGRRILATGQKNSIQIPSDIAKTFPAIMHLRLYGMNANGKVYELDAALGLNR